MSDFKLRLYNLAPETDAMSLADDIVAKWGEDFDAARGEFTASMQLDDGREVVDVVMIDVARGDAQQLVEDIYAEFGDVDDMMMVRALVKQGRGWFSIELEDDDDV